MSQRFRLTLIHPCIGRRVGEKYLKLWQMEPLPPAVIAALTPRDVEITFHDDRLETIPYDAPTDLVAISVETYTARRAYQIASEYRRRGVPVVMGGFHASLCPDEVARYAEAVVIGEAEDIWAQVIDDARAGTLKRQYRGEGRPSLAKSTPDRAIFRGKKYLPVKLIEAGRGCHLKCNFCVIQKVFHRSQTRRDDDQILAELRTLKGDSRLFFFIDDNVVSNLPAAKAFFRALIPLGIRWVSQSTLSAAGDEELLDLMERSGCQGVLIGFESLDAANLKGMDKEINTVGLSFDQALARFHAHHLRIYGTFVFGYDHDTLASFDTAVAFARRHGFFLTGFNHLTPFPGTGIYEKLQREGRLLYERWWLDEKYSYNQLPFRPGQLTPDQVRQGCLKARREFYGLPSIAQRAAHPVNRHELGMFMNYVGINLAHRKEVDQRDAYPLGDLGARPIIEVS